MNIVDTPKRPPTHRHRDDIPLQTPLPNAPRVPIMVGSRKPLSLQRLIKRVSSLGRPPSFDSKTTSSKSSQSTSSLPSFPDPSTRYPRLSSESHYPSTPEISQPESPPTPRSKPKAAIMGDEEDFSSLPLTDRWVHKVRFTPRLVPLVALTSPMVPVNDG